MVSLSRQRDFSEIEKQGMIKAFEYTHELAWNVMKDYFYDQGNSDITGSKDAIRESFHKGLILEGDLWMETIRSRNLSSHTYNEKIADEIYMKILQSYESLFLAFHEKMKSLL